MAVFTDATITEDVLEEDQILIRQGLTDKRINFNLAETLAWGARKESVYLGEHLISSTYDSLDSFRTYNNLPFFPKVGVTLPYTSNVSNPILDSNLTNISYTDYKDIINVAHDVGSTLLRFDSTNPETKYPWQTWSLISGDASIRLGDGTTQSQTPSGGSNDPTVPVPRHAHKIDHGHPSVTTSSNTHNHLSGMSWHLDDNLLYMMNGYINKTGLGFDVGGLDNSKLRLPYTDADTHNHSVQIPQYVGNTDSVGNAGATIDVRGRSIKMNLWVRTA